MALYRVSEIHLGKPRKQCVSFLKHCLGNETAFCFDIRKMLSVSFICVQLAVRLVLPLPRIRVMKTRMIAMKILGPVIFVLTRGRKRPWRLRNVHSR